MDLWGFLIAAAGLFGVVAGVANPDWFMRHPKAAFMCSILGRNGARVFYVVIGLGLVVLGGLIAAGVIHDKK